MTLASTFVPLAVAVVLGALGTTFHRRLPAELAARTISVTLLAITFAALPSLWMLSLGYLAHTPLLGHELEWCSALLGVHADIPTVIGVPAVTLAVVGVVRALKVLRSHRSVRCDGAHIVDVVESHRPFAYTLPGSAGRIVLSTGLLDLLDAREQAVVLAHERSHGRHRHDRMLLLAQLADALLPMLAVLSRRLHFSLERWADSDAVREVRGDERLVARTLARVALAATPDAVPALAFAGLGVPARVAALLGPLPRSAGAATAAPLWGAIGFTAVMTVYQLHHLAMLIVDLCRH